MSDITTTTVTADGVAVNHPARVKSIYYIRGASAGSIVLKGRWCVWHYSPHPDHSGRWLWRVDAANTMSIPSDGHSFHQQCLR